MKPISVFIGGRQSKIAELLDGQLSFQTRYHAACDLEGVTMMVRYAGRDGDRDVYAGIVSAFPIIHPDLSLISFRVVTESGEVAAEGEFTRDGRFRFELSAATAVGEKFTLRCAVIESVGEPAKRLPEESHDEVDRLAERFSAPAGALGAGSHDDQATPVQAAPTRNYTVCVPVENAQFLDSTGNPIEMPAGIPSRDIEIKAIWSAERQFRVRLGGILSVLPIEEATIVWRSAATDHEVETVSSSPRGFIAVPLPGEQEPNDGDELTVLCKHEGGWSISIKAFLGENVEFEIPESAFADVQTLRAALDQSALRRLDDPLTEANFVMRLAESLRIVEGRRERHAVMLLEAWLGISAAAYTDVQTLRAALDRSALRRLDDPLTEANFVTRLAECLRIDESRGERDAVMLLEAEARND